MITVEFPVPEDKIAETAAALMKEIKKHQAEIDIARKMLQLVQDGCEHIGQRHGHNERDGSWSTPCTRCGGGAV